MIPKIIHFIAPKNRSDWKIEWEIAHQTWEKHFGDFEIIVWSDDQKEMTKFVDDNYPQYSDMFKKFPYKICRIDFFRMLILHKFGGIYSDMDYAVSRNWFEHVQGHKLSILESQGTLFPSWQEEYTNALMASEEKNPFWIRLCENVSRILDNERYNNELYSGKLYFGGWIIKAIFGPIMLTNLIQKNNEKINLLPRNLYNPKLPMPYYEIPPQEFEKVLNLYNFYGYHLETNYWGDDICQNASAR